MGERLTAEHEKTIRDAVATLSAEGRGDAPMIVAYRALLAELDAVRAERDEARAEVARLSGECSRLHGTAIDHQRHREKAEEREREYRQAWQRDLAKGREHLARAERAEAGLAALREAVREVLDEPHAYVGGRERTLLTAAIAALPADLAAERDRRVRAEAMRVVAACAQRENVPGWVDVAHWLRAKAREAEMGLDADDRARAADERGAR